MRPHVFAVSLFTIIVVVSGCIATGRNAPAAQGELPGIKKDCGACHLTHAGQVSGLLRKPISDLCLGCHPERAGNREHVVDVVPSMAVTGFPLYEGRITCATCHDAHSNPYGKLLRMPREKLCQACHRK